MAANRILVIKHGAFGDFIQALGAMKAIRAHHAGDHITLMTTKPFDALARASGYFDDIYIDKKPKWFDMFGWLNLRVWLNAKNFSHVYDLQNSDRSSMYAHLLSNDHVWTGGHRNDPERRKMHVFEALRTQLASVGIYDTAYDDLSWIKADVPDLPKPYVLVVPGCSPTRLAKRWPPENYIYVCALLAGYGVTPVLIGTKDEVDVTSMIKAAVPKAIDLTGQTSLFQIAVLARGAAAAVGNDTGPMQMIGPTGCRTLALFPEFSDPVRHRPLGPNVLHTIGKTMADIDKYHVWDGLKEMLPMGTLRPPAH